MLFPIIVIHGLILDFSLIPIGLIGLYGELLITIILFLVAATCHFIVLGEDAGLAIMLVFIQSIISINISRYFIQWRKKKKIILVLCYPH